MASELITALAGVAERLQALLATDDELRHHVRALAEAILDATRPPLAEESARPAVAKDQAAEIPAVAAAVPAAIPPIPAAEQVAQREERNHRAEAAVIRPTPKPAEPPPAVAPAFVPERVTDADLSTVETRCRLKAEGARWAVTRRRRLAEGADFRTEIAPLDREIIDKATRLPDCFLWMCHPSGPAPSDLSLLEDAAGSFEAVADGIDVIRGLLRDPDGNRSALEQAMELLAEAQSALRVSVTQVGYNFDKDQQRTYQWLRAKAFDLQVYIPRYMRMDEAANPRQWPEISSRIGQLDARLEEVRQREKRYQAAIKRVRYHLKPLMSGDAQDHEHDWKIIIDMVTEMVRDGIPPSNTDIRELLLLVIDGLPDLELPQEFQLVLREIDRYLATRPPVAAEPQAAEPTEQVKAAADLLKGKTLVLVGGVRRPQAHEALRNAFGVKELDWVETKEHESISNFEANIARSDVAVVLLAIRWSSHVFKEIKTFCDKYGKPLVRLPAGYSPNQVAAQIMTQAGERLRGNVKGS